MTAYYNEFDKKAASWLRELIHDGLIAQGEVDDRSIADVQSADLVGFGQCHFFAGIGGWSYALRLAGWPDDRPVWTGSCPCQPFSCAGKQAGKEDERHLWPHFARLIRECRPDVVFGEQVANAVGFGWLDGVCADLEGAGYAVGAAVLGAHSVGAPHIRQRLYWVADAGGNKCGARWDAGADRGGAAQPPRLRSSGGVADAEHPERRPQRGPREDGRDGQDTGRQEAHGQPRTRGEVRGLADALRDPLRGGPGEGAGATTGSQGEVGQRERGGDDARRGGADQPGGMGLTDRTRECEVPGIPEGAGVESEGTGRLAHTERNDGTPDESGRGQEGRGVDGRACAWASIAIPCRDGKVRRVPAEPAFFPLVDGISPGRVGLLRGAGNAIVPQTAAAFIGAFLTEKST